MIVDRIVRRDTAIGTATTSEHSPRSGGSANRRRQTSQYFRRGRKLAAGTAIVAAAALALPASAAADAPDYVDNVFQVPALVVGACSPGMTDVSVINTTAGAGRILPGESVFRVRFLTPRDGSYKVTGSVTFAWLNLTTFQSGVASAPFRDGLTDFPYYEGPASFTGADLDAQTGNGQIIAIALANGSTAPNYPPPVPPEPCMFTPSVGTFFAF